MKASRENTLAALRRQIQSLESGGEGFSPAEPHGRNCCPDAGAESLAPMKDPHGQGAQEAFLRIQSLFSHRDRSELEVTQRLLKEDYRPEAVEQAIDRAKCCGLVDDIRFADAFIRARIHAGKGRCGIESDLKSKGIDPATLPDWPYRYPEVSQESQLKRAQELLAKQPPRSKNPLQSAYAKLIRKGYAPSVAKRAATTWFNSDFD